MYAIESLRANDLLEQFQRWVVHDGHVVAVPTDGARDMQHQFRHKLQHGTYLVGRALSGMVVACIDGQYFVVLGSIGRVEIMTAHRETL